MESFIPSWRRMAYAFEGIAGDLVCSGQSRWHATGRAWLFFGLMVLSWLVPVGSPVVQAQALNEAQRLRASGLQPLPTKDDMASDPRLAALLRGADMGEPNEPNEPNDVSPLDMEYPNEVEEPSTIELLLSGETAIDVCDVSLELTQFGYDIFRQAISTFAPVSNVPVGPGYVIGPGDRFTVTLWGRVDGQYALQVDRGGQVVLPEVGALKVWGMTFDELESYLQRELSRKYTDFKMSIAMDRLRAIRVFVVGEASAPGSYSVSSLSTVINALFAAGGPSKNGSLRKIRLLRNGADPVEIDLYNFLLGGDKGQDSRLQDGDTIFIPLIGPVAAVAGNVKRPAIYEMAGPMTLREVLDLAGGATFAGWLQRVQVERIENHERRVVVDVDISRGAMDAPNRSAAETLVEDGDIVKVFAVAPRQERVVHLEGHFLRPGKHEWVSGMRLRDILSSYEVLQPQPNTDHGEIERLVPPDLHSIVIPFNVGKVLAGDEAENIALVQYDTIRTFRWDERDLEVVTVSGMVFDPNQYRLVPGMRVSDLVDAAGGLKKNAYHRTAELTRRHVSQEGMTTEKVDIVLAQAVEGDPEQNILLRDYDHLVVRPIPELEFDRTVEILEQVRFPGTYPVRRGETLSSVIERAGGYTERAYLQGVVFTRESAKKVQRRRLDQLIKQIEESVLATAEQTMGGAMDAETIKGQQAALGAKKELLAKLRASEITGRVVVKLSTLEEFRRSRYDIELEGGDVLTVPKRPGVIHVVGEVFNETSLLYEDDGTVNYYLRRVGGMTKEADKKQLSVIKADGSVISKQQGRGKLVFWDGESNQWFFSGFMNLELEPGDTIVVPRKLDRLLWLKTTKDITQIVFQIAVAAGVVFAI
jgi:protein involved in polysaccharide export with SLBB domain